MATKAEQKAKEEARRTERQAQQAANRTIRGLSDPIDVDRTLVGETPEFTPGPVAQPASFEGPTVPRAVARDPKGTYGRFNYKLSYIRSEVGGQGKVLKILNPDEELQIVGEDQNGWTLVRSTTDPMVEGYVKTAFITVGDQKEQENKGEQE